MYEELTDKFSKVLGLSRQVVGIKFLFTEEEYDDAEAQEIESIGTFCTMTARGMKGEVLKSKGGSFRCQGGPEMLGMKPVSNYVYSGKQFSTFRAFEDMATARQAQRGLCFVDQKIYGVQTGPLSKLADADVVMFVCNAWQMMRVMQGYSYHNGMAKNIGSIGNQGICADLVARPYQLNDLNVSFLCMGARLTTGAEDGELGAGMPVHVFSEVADGVIKTVNPYMTDKEKKLLLERLDDPCELGFEVEFGKVYTSYIKDSKYSESSYKKELF